ncbi:hypothetical protein [Anaeromyxobacter diazotrophicus]|uniref:Uncharacterized protein n=1 Tax=Anaeromyxobacter diazotrophicus TaxID=2590199 RepID=A0A7I9VSR0_9BACT|nr:hypothetical protein [Anaeromyxobacter diazotrophicus]GEJ59341.1 hypothetical protein AMYX_40820 [Anaeromyxobacter diazotrophicus]
MPEQHVLAGRGGKGGLTGPSPEAASAWPRARGACDLERDLDRGLDRGRDRDRDRNRDRGAAEKESGPPVGGPLEMPRLAD